MDCRTCGGVVGVAHPERVERGQYYAARGGNHWEHEVVVAKKGHFALNNPRGNLIVFDSAENLHDEFFYTGCDSDELTAVIQAAEKHGEESEPDMELGDLQAVLYAAWRLMDPRQREKLIRDPDVQEVLGWSDQ